MSAAAGAVAQRDQAAAWFAELRDRICSAFEAIETEHEGPGRDLPAGRFERRPWSRPDPEGGDGGGGVMAVMHGRVFEKVGVNVSVVEGRLSEALRDEIPGADENPRFWAAGISLVAHMRSPLVPAAHMNTRHIVTTKSWFGGGADLTPTYSDEADTRDFHAALKKACDRHGADYYERFSKWCEEYFYLRHRDEPRGVGGIFYDYLEDEGDADRWARNFAFTRDVGLAFLEIYPAIVRRRMDAPWSEDQRCYQLERRGRYVEFNLLYDRGTRFGLLTGGNPDAILMSLPPLVAWP